MVRGRGIFYFFLLLLPMVLLLQNRFASTNNSYVEFSLILVFSLVTHSDHSGISGVFSGSW